MMIAHDIIDMIDDMIIGKYIKYCLQMKKKSGKNISNESMVVFFLLQHFMLSLFFHMTGPLMLTCVPPSYRC